jgi:YVTN family beta-propeller protein
VDCKNKFNRTLLQFKKPVLLRVYLVLLVLAIIGSCVPARPTVYKMPLGDQGEVFVYLQPLPQEAGKVQFTIGEIAAVRADGSQIPLSLYFSELQGARLAGEQKLLATGVLPPGSYSGLAIMVKNGSVQTEEGDMALLIPEEPVGVDKLFEVKRRQSSTLFLSLSPAGIVTDSIRFTPVFSLAGPESVLINFTGYVTNTDANIITVFNKKTTRVVNTIATGRGPRGIVLDQSRARAYVAVSGDDAVEVFDLFSGSIINTIRLAFGDKPIELALTPDGRTLVAVNQGSNTVSIIDAVSMFELTKVRVGEEPTWAAVDSSGLKAFVLSVRSNTISVVNLVQRAISLTISVKGGPLRAAFNATGDRLYVIGRDSPNLSIIDVRALAVIAQVFVGPGSVSLRVNARTGLILVGKKFGGEIKVVDPSSLMFIDSIKVGGDAAFMTIDREENTLFVVLPDKRLVQKLNLTSKKMMAEIEVGEGAHAAVVMSEI